MPTENVTIPSAVSSPDYQMQVTQLARQMADFKAQQDLESQQYGASYDQKTRRLGRNGNRWDPTIPNSQYGIAQKANTNDYAGRGMTFSGARLKSETDIDNDFNDRLVEMDREKLDYGNTQQQAMRSFSSQQEAVRQQAQAAAIATIAAKYGIDLGQVGVNSGSSITREIP